MTPCPTSEGAHPDHRSSLSRSLKCTSRPASLQHHLRMRVPLIQFPAHNTIHCIFTVFYSPELKQRLPLTTAPPIYLFEPATHTYSRTILHTPTTFPHQDSTSLTITRSSQSHMASYPFPTHTLLWMRLSSTMTTCTPTFSALFH